MATYDFPKLFATPERLVNSGTPVDEAPRRAIGHVCRVHPNPQGERMGALEVAADLSNTAHRGALMLRESPPYVGVVIT